MSGAPQDPPRRRLVLGLAAALVPLLVALLLPGSSLSWLRRQLPGLSQALSWLERRPFAEDPTHVVLFLLLGGLLACLLPRRRFALLAIQGAGLVLVLSAASEALQFLVPGRTPLWADVADNLSGGLAGLGVGLVSRALIGAFRVWHRHGGAPDAARAARSLAGSLGVVGLLLLPMQALPALPVPGREVMPVDLAFGLALCAWVGSLAFGNSLRLPTGWPWLMAYVGLMGLSCLASPAPLASLQTWWFVSYLAALSFLAFDLAGDPAWRKRLLLAWLAGAAVVVAISLWALFAFWALPATVEGSALYSHRGLLPAGDYPRIRSLFGNADAYCTYLAVSLAWLLLAREKNLVGRRVFQLGLAATALAAVTTVSPGLGAFALVAAAWLASDHRRSRPLRWFALVAGMGLALAAWLAAWLNPSDVSQASVRLQLWSGAWHTASTSPWLGVGAGQLVPMLRQMAPDDAIHRLTEAPPALLNVAGQAGWGAALALLGLWTTLLREAWRRRDLASVRAAGIALLAGFVVAGLHGSVEDQRHLWLVLGALAAALQAYRRETFSASCSARDASG